MNCNNCGSQVNPEAKYCKNCGHEVEEKIEDQQGSVGHYFAEKNEIIDIELRKAANIELWRGVDWFAAGLIITGISICPQMWGNLLYFLGLVIYGIYRLIMGVYYYSNSHKLIDK